jgi:non-ribosomal peptide synthetase component F
MATTNPVVDRLVGRLSTQPDAIALVAGEEQVSYAELGTMAQAAGQRLRSGEPQMVPLSPGSPIALRIAHLVCKRQMSTTDGPVSLDAVDHYTNWAIDRFDLRPGTVVLSHAPLDSGRSLLDVWATLKAGGKAVLVPPDRAADGQWLGDAVAAHGVEVLHGGSPLLRALVDAGPRTSFASVRRVIATGGTVTPNLLRDLVELFPRAGIHHLYGSVTSGCLVHEARHHHGRTLPIGQPVPGVEAMLVDRHGEVPVGAATGELWVRTTFHASTDWIRTGDLVRRDAHGNHFIIARNAYEPAIELAA